MIRTRRVINLILNYLVSLSAFLGVLLSVVLHAEEGYSTWYSRLFYFTQQSNIWVGVTHLIYAIIETKNLVNGTYGLPEWLKVLKLIFATCITITCLIFCAFLAPFADFEVWTFSSWLLHVVTPVLAVADYIFNREQRVEKNWYIFLAFIPLVFYFVFSTILQLNKVDFGLGETYPYPFLDLDAEVSFFGFKNGEVPMIGIGFWLIFIMMLTLSLTILYFSIQYKKEIPKGVKIIKENESKKHLKQVYREQHSK